MRDCEERVLKFALLRAADATAGAQGPTRNHTPCLGAHFGPRPVARVEAHDRTLKNANWTESNSSHHKLARAHNLCVGTCGSVQRRDVDRDHREFIFLTMRSHGGVAWSHALDRESYMFILRFIRPCGHGVRPHRVEFGGLYHGGVSPPITFV
ncbi:hypothetical protein PIB30_071910 [Stylosanthes scabra]|uniref:Uncharacterized protein n=1 Tax=Stylosanthes scabra TaxID=79078 RepID=A0ABU6TP37_9FABA|nr:hypothetical protein [Stylosanthes scabra]